MKCKKRYTPEDTFNTEVEEVPDVESEDEFEIISNHEEDQEVIQNQELQQEEEVEEERPAEVVREEPVPPPPQEIQDEGRKIYVTKSGGKYHLSQGWEHLEDTDAMGEKLVRSAEKGHKGSSQSIHMEAQIKGRQS